MDFFKKYTTPSGYVTDGNQADEYGINHSGFSTRDEPEYQFARQEREMQLADILNRQGIEQQNYPQPGTGFRQNNPENDFGFGNYNIPANIENK